MPVCVRLVCVTCSSCHSVYDCSCPHIHLRDLAAVCACVSVRNICGNQCLFTNKQQQIQVTIKQITIKHNYPAKNNKRQTTAGRVLAENAELQFI